MVRNRTPMEGRHDARHEAAHTVAALYFHIPVAYATLTLTGGACRMGTVCETYQEELKYIEDHAEDYAVIYMAGKAFERLAGTPPSRIVAVTEADHTCAREMLQKKTGDPDINSTAINDELERATERATHILADNKKLWDALTDEIFEKRTIRWERIRELTINLMR